MQDRMKMKSRMDVPIMSQIDADATSAAPDSIVSPRAIPLLVCPFVERFAVVMLYKRIYV
jgi:hypothetical protein